MLSGMLSSLLSGQEATARPRPREAAAAAAAAGQASSRGRPELKDITDVADVGTSPVTMGEAGSGLSASSSPPRWRWRDSKLKAKLATLAPSAFDVERWAELPPYLRTQEACRHLGQKGFCLVRSGLPSGLLAEAVREAAELWKQRAFVAPPLEVLCGLLGELGSAWSLELGGPAGQALEPGREALQQVEQHLHESGGDVAACAQATFGVRLEQATRGCVYRSRITEDRGVNPPLSDFEEADAYMSFFMEKKLRAVLYLGPSPATLAVTTIGDDAEAYRTQLQPGALLFLRTDVCRCTLDPKTTEAGITVEVNFVGNVKQSRREAFHERVPLPEALDNWYMGRLQAIVDNDVREDVPDEWIKSARELFFSGKPVRIREVSHELPTTAAEDFRCPFEGTAFGGNDCVTEIPMSKWDMNIYYDDDPMGVDDFKMYTRHMGVLDHELLASKDFFLQDGELADEARPSDRNHLLLCSSTLRCLYLAGLGRDDTRGSPMGVFCGLSSNEMYYHFLSMEVKLSKAGSANLSNAANVNRLSYILGSTGPSLAIDTEDSSGASAADTAVSYLRQDRCDQAVVGGINFVQHPFSLVVLCAAGTLSRTGRSRVFDETCDGFVRSEGVVVAFLEAHKWRKTKMRDADIFASVEEPELGDDEEPRFRALITGSALNSKGASSSLTAPSGPALFDVAQRALKDAQCPASILDAVEVSASGGRLQDATELAVLRRGILGEAEPRAVALRALKSCLGEAGAASGLAALARAVLCFERALHAPNIHLRQLFELAETCTAQDDDDRSTDPVCPLIPNEVLEASGLTQTIGVSSFGSSGTNVHQILWGMKHLERNEASTGQPIHWFPATVATAAAEAAEVQVDYHIVGSWTAWQRPCPMEVESPGVYVHRVTLGENCWETFQIWINGDCEQVLHPPTHWATKDVQVCGPSPSKSCGTFLTWRINGLSTKVRLINEAQFQDLRLSSKVPQVDGPDQVSVGYRGDYRPPGYENVKDFSEMPIIETNPEMSGVPGDPYVVRLHVRGKYRRVEWAKLPTSLKTVMIYEEGFAHCYYVVGSHNHWTFSPMQEEDDGLYVGEVHLLHDEATFVVVRDKDWDQMFYPKDASMGMPDGMDPREAPVLGPDGLGLGRGWRLQGKAGDVYRVQFQRLVGEEGIDTRCMSWSFMRASPPDFKALAKHHKYYLVGSPSDFTKLVEMDFDEVRGTFTVEMSIGPSGHESFQILLNKNWLAAVHPNINEVSFRDPGHRLEGPDDKGGCCYWAVGKGQDDRLSQGDRVRITMTVADGLPQTIHWERVSKEEALVALAP